MALKEGGKETIMQNKRFMKSTQYKILGGLTCFVLKTYLFHTELHNILAMGKITPLLNPIYYVLNYFNN